jgi:hypothetical protein
MIELVITCDRCGKTGGDGKSIQLGLAVNNPARIHLCTACVPAFHSWLAEYHAKEKAA